MTSSADASARGSRVLPFVAAIAAAVVAATYLHAALGNPWVGFLADDAIYLLMADVYSGRCADLPVYEHIRAHSQLPPLFPLVIALAGGTTETLAPARTVVVVSMLLAHGLFFVWLRQLRFAAAPAFALVLLHAVLPITLLHVVDLWSEGLYIAIVFLGLIALNTAYGTRRAWLWFAAGVLVGAACATRTVGIALIVPGVLLSLRASRAGALAYAAGVVVFGVAVAPFDMGGGGQSYLDLLRARYLDGGIPAAVEQLQQAAIAAWYALAYDVFQWRTVGGWRAGILALVIAASTFGAVAGAREPRTLAAAVYVLTYASIVALWPYPDLMDRFLLPLLPFVLYFTIAGARVITGNRQRARAAVTAIVIAAITAGAAPGMYHTVARMLWDRPPPEFSSFTTTRYWLDHTRGTTEDALFRYMIGLHANLGSLREHVPADACIATVLPNLVLLRALRVAWLPPSPAAITAGDTGPCDYFYVVPAAAAGHPALYPYAILGHAVEIVQEHRYTHASLDRAPVVGVLLRRKPR